MRGTLVLTRSQVARLLTLDACIAAIEKALRAHARGRSMPPQLLAFHTPEAGAFHLKAAGVLGRRGVFAAKINANFGRNPRRGLPRIQGVVALFDARDGRPLALLDSMELTALRTAAMTAVAARRLARADARTATICGCGLQGRVQLRALLRVRRLERAWCWDAEPSAAERYAREMSRELSLPVQPARRLAAALRESDVIVTCTPARRFFVREKDVSPGAFVAGVGADSSEKQELEPALLAKSRVVVDSLEQAATIGDLHHALAARAMAPRQVHAELADVVAGRKPGRRSRRETFVFDSTGIALQDVAAAACAYERALARGVGRRIALGV
jgi:ornithine cyclodeaminase/alanine dehydrogenase-like protein (mu-crystallin family)